MYTKLTITLLKHGYRFQADGYDITINRKTIFRNLFRYREAEVIIPFDNPFKTPVILIVLARIMSRGMCFIRCAGGTVRNISWMFFLFTIFRPRNIFLLVRALFRFIWFRIRDLFRRKRLLREITREVDELLKLAGKRETRHLVDLSKPVVYLRTLIADGLQAGGSIGHIAGVLNNLGQFTAPPLFITTERIPTVHDTVNTWCIRPTDDFSNNFELRDMFFSRTYEHETLSILRDVEPSFIYNRISLFNYSGVNVARRLDLPLVIEYNGSEVWVCRHWGTPLKYDSIAAKIELCSLRLADVIIVVSATLRDDLLEMGVDPKRILVVPNGVDPDVYSPDTDGSGIRSKYGLENKTVIGFIGTFGHWHGAEILAEAFGMLIRDYPEYRDRVRLLMIGDGLKMPEVRTNLDGYGVADCAVLTGLVHQQDGPEHLAACDILVSPHRPNPDGTPFFGSPTKLFEYMAMGKGIVASRLDQIGEILEHGKTAWMVKPGDLLSLEEGIKSLIDDRTLRVRLGAAARSEVIENYTWREHTRKIIEKVKDVIG